MPAWYVGLSHPISIFPRMLSLISFDAKNIKSQFFIGAIAGLGVAWFVGTWHDINTDIFGLIFTFIIVGLLCISYLGMGVSFGRAVTLMILTLPLTHALVIDIGVSLRLSHIFGLLAAVLLVRKERINLGLQSPISWILLAYVIYAFISISYTLNISELEPMTSVGWRGSIFRSFIQFNQLVLMVLTFYVTVNYVDTIDRLHRVNELVFWGLCITAVYGVWEFVAFQFHFPFWNLNNTPLDGDAGALSLSQRLAHDHFLTDRQIGHVYLHRIRAFAGEPQFLSTYLAFSIPLAFLSAMMTSNPLVKFLKGVFCLLGVIVFLATNSRSGYVAGIFMLVALILLSPYPHIRRWGIVAPIFALAILGFVLLPFLGDVSGLNGIRNFITKTFNAIIHLEGRSGSFTESLSIFWQSPLLGVGLGNYIFYVPISSNHIGAMVSSAANVYLHVLAELGLIGLMLFLSFVGLLSIGLIRVIFRVSDHQVKMAAFTIFVALVGTMICRGASSALYSDSFVWVLWGLGFSVIQIARKKYFIHSEE